MENMTAIARPYAVAAFEFALAQNALSSWENFLEMAAVIVKDTSVKKLLETPGVSETEIVSLMKAVLGRYLDSEKQNFLHLLAQNKRLAALPEVLKQFKLLEEAQQKEIAVKVSSAVPLDKAYQEKLAVNLAKKLQRKVALQYEVNAALLGGVMIRAGDKVIDGSIRGKLDRLLDAMS